MTNKKKLREALINSDSYKRLLPNLVELTDDRLSDFVCGYYEEQISEILSANLGEEVTKNEIEELHELILEMAIFPPTN